MRSDLYCISIRSSFTFFDLVLFDLSQLYRSHFTIKSVLTPLLLNKYAR